MTAQAEVLATSAGLLDPDTFRTVVHHAPLVAIDLLVQDADGRLLLGHRTNPPARGYWFAPGGRIRKHETLAAAFARITAAELGRAFALADAEWVGVYEHFYDDDFRGEAGAGTHYVVLAHRLRVEPSSLQLPDAQHDAFRWVGPESGRTDSGIHANTRVYFDAPGR